MSTNTKFIIWDGSQCAVNFTVFSLVRRSGTEEEYDELTQLLEDIYTFRKDAEETQKKEKENKKQKEKEDKRKAEEMREAALLSLGSKFIEIFLVDIMKQVWSKVSYLLFVLKYNIHIRMINFRLSDNETDV